MENKEMLIGGGLLIAFILIFPIVYTNWPRDPNPAIDAPIIAQFSVAVGQYRKDFGMLPKKLDDLKPKYFSEIPKASNREAFIYDANTGKVTPPYPLTGEKVEFFKDMGMPIAGTSPMGEIMTGISIQNELNY